VPAIKRSINDIQTINIGRFRADNEENRCFAVNAENGVFFHQVGMLVMRYLDRKYAYELSFLEVGFEKDLGVRHCDSATFRPIPRKY